MIKKISSQKVSGGGGRFPLAPPGSCGSVELLKHQIGHPPTGKSKEFSESKLYKKASSQVIHGALNNPLSQYCLAFLGFLNFMLEVNVQKRLEHIILGFIVAGINHKIKTSEQSSKKLNL